MPSKPKTPEATHRICEGKTLQVLVESEVVQIKGGDPIPTVWGLDLEQFTRDEIAEPIPRAGGGLTVAGSVPVRITSRALVLRGVGLVGRVMLDEGDAAELIAAGRAVADGPPPAPPAPPADPVVIEEPPEDPAEE